MRFEEYKKSKELKDAEKADAELASSLSPKKEVVDPRPATVSSKIADIERDWYYKKPKKLGEVVPFTEKKKPEESGPDQKAA